MIKDETIDKLEEAGFRVDCTIDGISIYSGDKLAGVVFLDHPSNSWIGGEVLRNILSLGDNALTPLFELIAFKQSRGYMPDLFILKTDVGFIKRGESLGFTQSDPTLFTKKQLDRVRLRVAALNPITYKVN